MQHVPSAFYGGEKAIATYACVSYIICIIYLILQGVGDGSQLLMSRYYGGNDRESLKSIQKMAYIFAGILAVIVALSCLPVDPISVYYLVRLPK